jgi:hypothetical protein
MLLSHTRPRDPDSGYAVREDVLRVSQPLGFTGPIVATSVPSLVPCPVRRPL